jgi:hypothetical protein
MQKIELRGDEHFTLGPIVGWGTPLEEFENLTQNCFQLSATLKDITYEVHIEKRALAGEAGFSKLAAVFLL